VCWKQGDYFGLSSAADSDSAAYEEAIAAIRSNAGIDEIPPREED